MLFRSIREKQLQQCWMVWVEKLNTIVRTLAMDQTDQPQNGRLPTQTDFDPNPCSNILIQTHVATRPPGFFSACKLPQPSHFLLLHLIQFFALRFHIFEALFCRHLKSHILSRQLLVSVGIGDTILQFVDTITASQKVCRHHHGISESCRHHQGISESCRHHHGIHRSISRHHHGIYKSF